MTKIEKVLRDIQDLQDFYKRTKSLRARIKKKELERNRSHPPGRGENENGYVTKCNLPSLIEKLHFCH